jgi:hypothetical protein
LIGAVLDHIWNVIPRSAPGPTSGTPRIPAVSTAGTIASLAQAFETREKAFLPDLTSRLSRLRVNPDGTLEVPSVGEVAMTEWSAAQFARLLGFRESYFEHAAPNERSDELQHGLDYAGTGRTHGRTPRAPRLKRRRTYGNPLGFPSCI